jgi:hypothetical protein
MNREKRMEIKMEITKQVQEKKRQIEKTIKARKT